MNISQGSIDNMKTLVAKLAEYYPEERAMSRFDYVKYDDKAVFLQASFKTIFQDLDELVTSALGHGRSQALVATKLEEAYMWIGKAIRDDQIERNGVAELQEERNNE